MNSKESSNSHHMALPAGYHLDHYRIEGELGHGGFGITYRAVDTRLDRSVAIKEYLPRDLAFRNSGQTVQAISQTDHEMFEWGLDRFLDEARTLGKFNHPNIVRVLQFFRANDTAYLVMEYCEGEPLDRILKREGRLPSDKVIKLTESLLNALGELHKLDVIHRDIKPANIYIHPTGNPVLLDFGSARQALGGHSRSMTSVIFGQRWNGATCVGEPNGFNWEAAKHFGSRSRYAGHGDWRLPDIYELHSIIYCSSGQQKSLQFNAEGSVKMVNGTAQLGDCKGNFIRPAIDTAAFPTPLFGVYWSSSHGVNRPWAVGLFIGGVTGGFPADTTSKVLVRLVRDQ